MREIDLSAQSAQKYRPTTRTQQYMEHRLLCAKPYSFIVLIIDDNDIAIDIAWQKGIVQGGQSADLSISWTPQDVGIYTIKLFVWDGFDDPLPLSEAMTNRLSAG